VGGCLRLRPQVGDGHADDQLGLAAAGIGRALLAGDVRDGAVIRVDLAGGELAVTYQNPPEDAAGPAAA
jgi:hypothetical protein